MRRIRRFNEFLESSEFDYDRIIKMMKKIHNWGLGIVSSIEDFEKNDEYFKQPIDENDYVEQFHIYLTDLEGGRLRNQFNNNTKLRVGKWKIGPIVNHPNSIWSQRT